MGSFNTACFVSRQTIASGDPCVITAIAQKATYRPVELTYRGETSHQYGVANSTCYPTGFWAPVSHFFDAVYDDYGRVTLDDTPMNRTRLWYFLQDALSHTPTVAQGENTCHDVPYDLPAFMQENAAMLYSALTERTPTEGSFDSEHAWQQSLACWDYLFEVAQEQRMFWRNYQGVLRPMSYAIIHRAAWTTLVARTETQVGWRGESYAMRAVFDRAVAAVKERLADFDKVDLSALPPEELEQGRSLLAVRKLFAFDQFHEAIKHVGSSEGSSYPCEHSAFMTLGEPFVQGHLTEDALFEAVAPWLQARYACASLESLNLHFEPIVYASQDYSNDIGASYRQFVDEVEAQVTRGRQVRCYGELTSHRITVTHREGWAALQAYTQGQDVCIRVLSETPDEEVACQVQVTFEASLDGADLREHLLAFQTETGDQRLRLDSLEALPQA